jgi:group I intron endonuclease
MTKHSAEERFKSHVKNSYNNKQLFMRAIQKYGEENFKVENIDYAETIEEAWEKEQYWIAYYKSNHSRYPNNGYNMTDGGEGITGYTVTEDHRRNLSIANTGKIMPDWVKKKISEEHRSRDGLSDKQSAHLKELHSREISEEEKERLRTLRLGVPAWNKGKKMPEEAIKKSAEARIGLKQSNNTKYKRKKTWLIKSLNDLLDIDLVGFLFDQKWMEESREIIDEIEENEDYDLAYIFITVIIDKITDEHYFNNLRDFDRTYVKNKKSGMYKIRGKLKGLIELYKEVS